jgi:hypothetical protein
MRTRSTIVGFAVLTILLTAGAAQSLSGSNTVFTDDIAPGAVNMSDIHENAVTSSRIANGSVFSGDIANNAVTGTDINESTLQIRRHFVARIKVPVNGDPPSVVDGDATGVSPTAVGTYRVTFPFAISACTATANVANFTGANNQFLNGVWAVTDVFDPNPNVVIVSLTTVSAGGTSSTASSFVLNVSCPAP